MAGVFKTTVLSGSIEDSLANKNFTGTMDAQVRHPSGATNLGFGLSTLEDAEAGAENNTALGVQALQELTTGDRNTAVGYGSLEDNTTADNSTAVGYDALVLNNGGQNQAFGAFTLDANTSGVYNTAMGYAALGANASGNYNVAIGGLSALGACVSGVGNVAIGGSGALASLDDGDYNVAIGYLAGEKIEGGSNNTLVGRWAGSKIVDPDFNTCIGYASGDEITTGTLNTTIGFNAGSNVTTGNYNTLIGRAATASAAGVNNEITLGSANVTALRCQRTSISALSDARDKDEIQDLSLGLDYIQQVRPVEFVWQMRDGAVTDKKDFGFIAQEMMAVEDANDAEWVSSVLRNNPERLEVAPAQLLPIAIKAIQELSAQLDELKAKVGSCKCQGGK